MLTRRRQLAAKIEITEGSAETLAAVDAALLAYSPKITIDPTMLERDPVRASFSQAGKTVGKRPGSATFKLELRGSGTPGTAPGWAKILQACGFEVNTLKQLTIGVITGGPFQHGEVITGGTSTATGRVVIATSNGTTKMYFVSTSTAQFSNGETITGGTSGATAAVSGTAPLLIGNEIKPISTAVPSLTIGSFEDGTCKLLKGARGTVKFTLKAGEPCMMDFTMSGVEAGVSDLALLSGISFESTKPPVFVNASLLIDALAAKLGEIDIDMASILAARDSVNESAGLLSYAYTGRKVNGSLNPEMVTVATYDFFGKLYGGTEALLDFSIGSVSGNKFRFYAPKLQYTKVEDADNSGLQLAKCSFDLNGSLTPGNDELVILAM